MRVWSIALMIVIAGGAFGYGFAVRHLRVPPYDQLRELFRMYDEKAQPKLPEFTLNTDGIAASLADLSGDIEASRQQLISRVILPAERITVARQTIDADHDEITTEFYGIRTKSLLTRAARQRSCLRIYVEGHDGDPFQMVHHNRLLDASVNEGCDMLSMSMLGLGFNDGPAEFPSGRYQGQTSRLDWREAHRHGSFIVYHDTELPQYDFLALFLSPHYYTIRSLLDDYSDVSVMGISGGGWYTVMMAALIPEVDYSIVYAGSLPDVYRTSEAFFGDYEEFASSVYSEFDYWRLYQLASHRDASMGDRVQYFVFNDFDECCFMDPAASHFASVAPQIYGDRVRVIVGHNRSHSMDVEIVKQNLDRYRRAGRLSSPTTRRRAPSRASRRRSGSARGGAGWRRRRSS